MPAMPAMTDPLGLFRFEVPVAELSTGWRMRLTLAVWLGRALSEERASEAMALGRFCGE